MNYQPRRESNNRPSSAGGNRMEVGVPLGERLPSSSPIKNRSVKIYPHLPYLSHEGNNKNKNEFRPNTSPGNTSASRVDKPLPAHPPPRGRRNTTPSLSQSQNLLHSPAPSMSNSSKKILQLTGYDASIDRSLPIPETELDDSPASSGSCYSLHEDGNRLSRYSNKDNDISGDQLSYPEAGQHAGHQFQAGDSNLPLSKDEGETITLRVEESYQIGNYGQKDPKLVDRITPADMATLNHILYEKSQRDVLYPENSKYRRDVADTRAASPPKAQTISRGGKTKPKPTPISVEVPKKPSFFVNARDNFAWGMDDITPSPMKHKHYNTPVTGTFPPPSGLGSPGPQPLSPLSSQRYGARPSPISPEKLHRRISNTVKHWSPTTSAKSKFGKKTPQETTIDTSSSSLTPTGKGRVDTPIPSKSSFIGFSPTETFQRGNEHFLDAVTKARAMAHIKTKDEKKRESLKKKIVVVGVTDQSPDGRLSEWL